MLANRREEASGIAASSGDGARKRGISRRKRFVFIIFTVGTVLVIGLATADLFVYYATTRFSESTHSRVTRDTTPSIYQTTPTGGNRLRRFLDIEYRDPVSDRTVELRTNAFGYRGGPIAPKQAGELRILCLGDSITLASYVEEGETYPSIVQELLTASGREVSVLNAGIAGAALREELLSLNETGLFVQADVVVVGLYLNDAQSSKSIPIPEGLLAHSAIARRLSEAKLGGEMLSEGRAEWARLAKRPYPEGTFAKGAWRTDRSAFEAEIATAILDWGRAFFPWAWEQMEPDLAVMAELGEKHHFKLAVALFPTAQQMEAEFVEDGPQRMFAAMMERVGAPALDLLPVLRSAYRRSGRSLAYDHCHLTPEGNRVAAEAMAGWLGPKVIAGN